MKHLLYLLMAVALMLLFTTCKKDNNNDSPSQSDELNIPEDFNFSTEKTYTLSIDASGGNTSVDVYIYKESMKYVEADDEGTEAGEVLSISETFENKIHSTYIFSGQTQEIKLRIPKYLEKLYVVTRTNGSYKSYIQDVNNRAVGSISASHTGVEDVLYCVNAQGDLFSVNPITGEADIFGTLPSDMNGSVTCAMDNENDILYTIGRSSPYKLYAYNLLTETFTYKGDVGKSGPRLEYREVDQKLYFSTSNKIYKIDPANAEILQTYTVNGLHNSGWGDVAFTEDGTLFMATYSGLYRLDDTGDGSTYDAVRISADNLPFNATSLTFDSNGELWLATVVSGQGRLIIMDQVTGGWEYRFDPYSVGINDLTTMLLDPEALPDDDSDGDGVPNYEDDYPDDPEASGNTYTPSVYGWGTYAFEDLWPFKGDYDFNDLVVNHRGIIVSNSNNEIVRLIIKHQIKNIGASYTNGFGYAFPDLSPSKIASISGQNFTENIISNLANGVEAGHTETVIIVFDNAFLNEPDEFELTVEFTEPITPEELGIENINPFIFVDKDRSREIHLSGKVPTALAVNSDSYFGTGDDSSNPQTGRYYKDNNNMPWAISIIHDFVHPKEKHNIMDGYVRFRTWAESGGAQYLDWYKDQDGNRNYAHLEQ